MDAALSRDDLATLYLDQLPYEPYPVQEEALLTWFTSDEGVLVCAPTGTGKTLIAEAALFEALHTRQVAYYTTPLIALTEQKFTEIQAAAVRWGFSASDVGLVTGNRKVNPDARVLVVVAEILLNRLLDADQHDFSRTFAVVMDEFHSFNDPERGAVWELSLGLLPRHVRLMLLSATIGNAAEFLMWLRNQHERKLRLVQSNERKIPLTFRWIPDQMLDEQLELMCEGNEEQRLVPALIFCFNRSECWTIAEQLKGKKLVSKEQQQELGRRLDQYEWNRGAGTKLKPILMRGVGVHHAGILPRYRRIVEELFQQKLLSVCLCTETLAAGINLPARSVVLKSLLKGPPGKMKLIDPSAAHQMFGRAGRPQFDSVGYVFALPDEDDVKILRFKERYDQIPEDTKDPQLIKAKKQLKKKMPTRNSKRQYWNEEQFEKLRKAPPANLASRGHLPWRMLAWLLKHFHEVVQLRLFVSRRMLDPKQKELAEQHLYRMLQTLWAGGFIELLPEPPPLEDRTESLPAAKTETCSTEDEPAEFGGGILGSLIQEALQPAGASLLESSPATRARTDKLSQAEPYVPREAIPTEKLDLLLNFRGVNPVYACFLLEHLGQADEAEQLQILESTLEVPGSVARDVRIPFDYLVSGHLARTTLDRELIARGLLPSHRIWTEVPADPFENPFEDFPPPVAEKMRMLFQSEYPGVHSLPMMPVWIAADLLKFNGDFDKYISGRDLSKQEGIIFRHLLRFVLLLQEFLPFCPVGISESDWQTRLLFWIDTISKGCRAVDPVSTDEMLAEGLSD
ncbi:MAG: DEAD/DEAH box helicase [Planctomycetaceae bacterium]|nr:DEAD/DEAH box helicase [Planctomycetaceae bacterium]